MYDDEGRWDVHFMPCSNGCHHLTQVDLADSRAGFQAHVEHLMTCSGLQNIARDREQAVQVAKGCGPISEREARSRFEDQCWTHVHTLRRPDWHRPHTWCRPGSSRLLTCYGMGSYREVPPLPQAYYKTTHPAREE